MGKRHNALASPRLSFTHLADQLGHSLDVSQNVYTQSPVESRLPAVNQLEKSVLVM
jgi:hypothetical protein